ncbi:MAG: 3-phosphoshikimate 1-carboxyvinyltransferase, partial [Gracilibacteraceae bacterium]|nr:3-phosphoshikimate 1-carboxyvinyltransferase [Gracilibacteraceae bacterium]
MKEEKIMLPGLLRGTVSAPPSKSMAHRALICAALASGVSRLYNMEASEDILATAGGLRALGAAVTPGPDYWEIRGIAAGGREAPPEADGAEARVDCNESGSTLRFLLPLFPVLGLSACFTGRGRLGARPLEPYRELLTARGLDWEQENSPFRLRVSGRLSAGEFSLPGDVSSQFVSGLCFALPLLAGDSVVRLTTELESAPYLAMTLSALREFGVEIRPRGPRVYEIPGGQRYVPRATRIEGDYSQAAFFLVAGTLGSDVTVTGLRKDSLQADTAALPLLARLGAHVRQ